MEEQKWSEIPQKAEFWKNEIDYVMFIDENGNAEKIKDISNKLLNNITPTVDEKYFTITGCIFEKKDYSLMRNNVRKLKGKYWENGYYYDTKHKDTRYVCFHSRDIRRHNGAFNDSIINYNCFINDLSILLKETNCKIISITIDFEEYIKKNEKTNVYEKAFDLLLERYIYATKNNKKGMIILESRGKDEDKILLKHICEVIFVNGSKGINKNELKKKIKGVFFNPKWYGGLSSTYSGLEIADLFSYPIHQTVKYKEKSKSFLAIVDKIDCYPDYNNKGIKIYPKEKDDIHRP